MVETIEFDVWTSIGNLLIAKHPDRNYPGALIQGDTLRCLLDEVEELQEELESGDIESVKDISDALKDRLVSWLSQYEVTLRENHLEIPYVNTVSKGD